MPSFGDAAQIVEADAELEALGYSALWVPDVGGPLFEDLDRVLQGTTTVTIAGGCCWDLASANGLVVGEKWSRPLATMSAYLNGLESAEVPLSQVCLAALGPKMLELARDRTAGAHPYLVTPEHNAIARAALGNGLVAVEQGVILESSRAAAHEIAGPVVKGCGGLPNYANSWKRLGFTDDDISSSSDRLIDALIASGDAEDIAQRIEAHQEAGADHVCIQAITTPGSPLLLDVCRRLAPH